MRGKIRHFAFLALGLPLLVVPTAVNAGGPVGGRFVIYNSAGVSETEAAVAYNSQRGEYLVVWTAESAGPIREIWGRRVARSGRLLGAAFRISPAGGNRYDPSVAYDSQHDQYMVVWEDGLNVQGRVISATGGFLTLELLIYEGYPTLDSATNPQVAYATTADQYLVVWQYGGGAGSSLLAQAYDWNGAPNGSTFDVVPYRFYASEEPPEQPAMAYNRSRNEHLVAWQQKPSGGDYDVYARRVKMSGGAGALPGFIALATSATEEVTPAVAAIPTVPNYGQYLVAWESDDDVQARPVAGDVGSIGAIRTLADTPWTEYLPALAGCEACQQFLAVWVWIPAPTPPGMLQVQARTLDLNGTPLHATTTVGGGQVFETTVAAGLAGDFLIPFDDNEDIGISNRGIYGYLWGNHIVLPLVLRDYP